MTESFHYDTLTWPEVVDLPRDVPLVIPLGSSFDFERVAAQLGNSNRLGILSFFPSAGEAHSRRRRSLE